MTKLGRAYRAIARAHRMHLPEPKWAIEMLEKETLEIEQNIINTLERPKEKKK